MKLRQNTILPVLGLVIVLFSYAQAQNRKVLISPSEANSLISRDTTLVVLDVRTLAEYNSDAGHLKGAVLIPVGELESRMQALEPYKDKTILVYCRSGHRSGIASDILLKSGYTVRDLKGGINNWKSENLPVIQETE